MHFPIEALQGIFDSLEESEKSIVARMADERGVYALQKGTPERAMKVQQILVERGHILPFDLPATDIGAREYDEIMRAQELMK